MTIQQTPILKIEHICKNYTGVRALYDVDFELQAGEVRALLGKNGAGKSTLVKVLSGATLPTSGSIAINGQSICLNSPADAFAAGIATVYQEMSLVKGLTVAENILLGRWPHKTVMGLKIIDQKQMLAEAKKALELMGVQLNLKDIVGQLNVPEQQMVEIAKAVSFNPKVLILDEPTSALPQAEVDHLLALVRELAKNGVAVIYVSHRLQEIPRVADSLTVLRDGQLIGTIPTKEGTPEKIANMMIGGEWTKTLVEFHKIDQEKPVLSVVDLNRKKYLHNISFDLHKGEVLGIAGLLGSGRSELLRAIFGLDPIDSGKILIDGVEIQNPNPAEMKSRGLGLTPEDRKAQGLVMPLDVADNLTISCFDRISNHNLISIKTRDQLATKMVDAMSIRISSLKTPVLSLSGGNQQKVVIGKWLNAQVKILLMDEPTRGIDIQSKEQVYKLVRDLADQGISVIFVSSEVEEVVKVSDRILILNQGRICTEIPANQASLEQVLALCMEGEVVA
jgi:ribose transport system ATP-binding protein